MNLFRSKFVERSDPSFRKYFDWPTHKDPKGTVKTQTVLEGKPNSLPLELSSGVFKLKKKKKTLKNPLRQKVADEDFHLLEAFINEYFEETTSYLEFNDQVKFFDISYFHLNEHITGFCPF